MLKKAAKKIRKYTIPHEDNDFKPHLLRYGGIVLLTIFIAGSFFASNIHRFVLKTTDLLSTVLPAVLVDLANSDRLAANTGALTINPKLEEAARMKALDMAAKGYFAHHSPEGTSPWYWIKQSGYEFVYAGENLAVNFDDSEAVNTAWMNSPGHRANILNNKFTEVGIATAKGYYQGKETTFVVQMFGMPAKKKVAPVAVIASSSTASTSVSVTQAVSVIKPISNVTENPAVLGESEVKDQIFIAVQDTSAEPAENLQEISKTGNYAGLFERIASSPTRMLGFLYLALAFVLAIMLLFAMKIRHSEKGKHIASIILILLVIVGIFSYYQKEVRDNVGLPKAQRISL